MIVGTQRTGTTWIRTTLDSHPSIQAHGEVFLYSHGRFPLLRTAGHSIPGSYGAYLDGSISRKLMHFTRRRTIVAEYLDHLYADTSMSAVGFKLMRNQARQFPSVMTYARQRNISAIHIIRKNALKTLISRESSRRRKVAHSVRQVPIEKVSISTDRLIRRLDKITNDNCMWERVLTGHLYLKIVYEDFVADQGGQLNRIYSFLSVPPGQNVGSSLVKINPNSISDILLNHSEVSRTLKGTPYEWCLRD